ncbi:MAG: hypothetical protein A3H98_02430, partial [Bacteroidetes bacterium RIFCSPLOWO2_02_FULL_36_8]
MSFRINHTLHIFLFFFIFILVLVLSPAYAQNYRIEKYSVEAGMAQASVVDIEQDKDGNIWFATSGGATYYNGKTFETVTTGHGLLNNRVREIFCDKKGNIWIGTGEGISVIHYNSFLHSDTLSVKNYTKAQGLPDNRISSIIQDTKNRIWITTTGGVARYLYNVLDTSCTKCFSTFTVESGLFTNQINSIYEDLKGQLWLCSQKGLAMFNPDDLSGKILNPLILNTSNGLKENTVRTIAQGKDGIYWIGLLGSLMRMKLTDDDKKYFTLEDGVNYFPVLFGNQIQRATVDPNGDVWIGAHGALRISEEGSDFISMDNGLGKGSVRAVFHDREGNTWFGTSAEGSSKFRSKMFSVYSTDHGLICNDLRAILEDHRGWVWMAGATGLSLLNPAEKNYQKPYKKLFRNYSTREGINYTGSLWSLAEDKEGNIWIGAGGGISVVNAKEFEKGKVVFDNFLEADGLKNPATMALYQDKKGRIWAGTLGGIALFQGKLFESKTVRTSQHKKHPSFNFYGPEKGIPFSQILDIKEDARGNLWIGSGGGLLRLKELTDDTIEVEIIGTQQGLKNIHILSITEDKVGNLWLGTAGGVTKLKVIRNEPLEVSVTNYTVKDGLSSDTPYLLLIDSKGDLWVGTNRGVDRFYIRQGEFKKIKSYDKDQGFSGIECNHNAGWMDRNGNLWFGTMGGAIYYNGREDKPNLTEPLVKISELKLFYDKINPVNFEKKETAYSDSSSSLLFNYNQNHLTFEYIGVSLSHPDKVTYQYMLRGFDNGWSPVTRE